MGRLLGRRPAAPAKSKGNALPPLRIQSLFNRWDTGGWRLEFDSWVFKYELVRAIFSDGALPTGFTLEPTRKDEAPTELTLYWTLRWPGHTSVPRAQLTGFGRELAARAVSGTGEGEELPRTAGTAKARRTSSGPPTSNITRSGYPRSA